MTARAKLQNWPRLLHCRREHLEHVRMNVHIHFSKVPSANDVDAPGYVDIGSAVIDNGFLPLILHVQ